jgi:hypothetical protein
MSEMTAIRKVALTEHHLRPGRTKHTLSDSQGRREFPPFTSLVIAKYPEDPGFYLMHVCENGQGTDTWHETLDDALHQAEFEFEVKPEEWKETNEPF